MADIDHSGKLSVPRLIKFHMDHDPDDLRRWQVPNLPFILNMWISFGGQFDQIKYLLDY